MNDFNHALLKLSKRAESYDPDYLVDTFVDFGSVNIVLNNPDHQIIYGRRGTGKTHALSYLANQIMENGDIVVSLDMRTIGSSGGIYSDNQIEISERATRLLVDTLEQIHNQLLESIIERDDLDLSILGKSLDALADASIQVYVSGPVERLSKEGENITDQKEDGLGFGFDLENIGGMYSYNHITNEAISREVQEKRNGNEKLRVHFGSVQRAFTSITKNINGHRIWVLMDEWSEIPLDLQPILADLIRRTLLPLRGISVKISAIEMRSRFCIDNTDSDYIGIELGADISTNITLDDYMVFDNDAEKARDFFQDLFYKHLKKVYINNNFTGLNNKDSVIKEGFTNVTAFDELVRATEGVPRDAINIAGISAQKASENQISVPIVRVAAMTWYNRSKESAIRGAKERRLLTYIIDKVIQHRKARAFLLKSGYKSTLIENLFDARILHLLKKGISSQDEPGARYDAWAIDYGCYVNLINTSSEPMGLFEIDTDEGAKFVEVPETDYRSIRRAILEIDSLDYHEGKQIYK